MRTTITLARNLNCSPFEIFDQEIDEVILLINFYIELGEKEPNTNTTQKTRHTPNTGKRVKVNSKTATGGWY